jgi:hypothetical protein
LEDKMPIKGLTDRQLSFPEIGQVRKGAPKEQGKIGRDLDYFRVTFDEQETEAAETFTRVYGEKPTEINVILPFDEIERCWDAWYEAYTAGRMVARSDGESFVYLVDVKTGEQVVVNGNPKTPHREIVGYYTSQNSQKQEAIKCRPVGRLRVMVRELARAAYLTVLTTSVHDIANISAQLEAFKRVNGGRIAGIPLVLRRRPRKISVPKADGSKMRLTKWMLSIEADPTWVKALLLDLKKSALPGNGLALLPEPEAEQDDVIDGEMTDVTETSDDGEEWEHEIFDQNREPEEALPEPEPEPVTKDLFLAIARKAHDLGLITGGTVFVPKNKDELEKAFEDLRSLIIDYEAQLIENEAARDDDDGYDNSEGLPGHPSDYGDR